LQPVNTMATTEDFIQHLKANEGDSTHLYRDTNGYPTVGIGFKLSNVKEAQNLKFVNPSSNKAATLQEIEAEFNKINEQPVGMRSSKYKFNLILPEEERTGLLKSKVEFFMSQLKQKFPSFDKYPDPVQIVLMDMAYNLGINGLISKFPKFTKAIKEEKWAVAAEESKRLGISSRRNLETKNLLLEAAKNRKKLSQ
jgi:GH24 family phage-related lysozyme (muramidase)